MMPMQLQARHKRDNAGYFLAAVAAQGLMRCLKFHSNDGLSQAAEFAGPEILVAG